METTIDSAGRIVIPKPLRNQVGLTPGRVDVHVEGSRIVIEPLGGDGLVERDGLWMIPASDGTISADEVRQILDEGRR